MELRTIGPFRSSLKPFTKISRLSNRVRAAVLPRKSWRDLLSSTNQKQTNFPGSWFYGSTATVETDPWCRLRAECLARAQSYRERRFVANGIEWSNREWPCHGRWDVDPASGKRWPATSSFSPLDHSIGDIRYVWEVDRLQHLTYFAQAWRYTLDPVWVDSIIEHISQVLDEAPFEYGIHWRDGLQLAIRIFSFVAAADLAHDAPGELNQLITKAVYAHMIALQRQMSPHSSITNNHAIGEAAGLILSGLFLRGVVGSAEHHLKRGLRRLHVELKRQIYSDGVPYEGSLPYVRFDLEFVLLTISALRSQRYGCPRWLEYFGAKIALALAAMVDCRGKVPPLGDGDEARVVRLDSESYLTVNETLHLAEKLLGKKALAPCPSTNSFALWIVGPEPNAATCNARGGDRTEYLRESGLIHVRRQNMDLWVDCGPTGLGKMGPGGHGHNDTAAVIIHVDGAPLVHDSGWYTYYKDQELRNTLRATAAHNTITIDGQEQARLGGLFEIKSDCHPIGVKVRANRANQISMKCGHTGYDRLDKGIRYRRFVTVVDGDKTCIQIKDLVTSKKPIDIQCHLNSGLQWKVDGERRAVLGEQHILLFLSGQTEITVSPSPYSVETGVLSQGSTLSWRIPQISCVQTNHKVHLTYLSRVRFTVKFNSIARGLNAQA